MHIEKCRVESLTKIKDNIYLLKVNSPKISSKVKPGQFCNVKVSESNFPLLRRPFSVSDVDGDSLSIMFDVHGEGTKLLSEKKEGDILDILGPLGEGFGLDDDYEVAIIIAGGLGSAPFPLVTKSIPADKKVYSFVGGREESYVVTHGMKNAKVATDDGSTGLHGNVIELIKANEDLLKEGKCKVFACGPTPMLKAVQTFCLERGINGEISTECAMACGFGICQGCAVEEKDNKDKYKLVCKDGPVFNVREVEL